jgi:guanylate kinase
MKDNNGKLIVISGPSGVGKSTISSEIVKRLDAFLPMSVTTRAIGENEVDGTHYQFISTEDFKKGIVEESFLEYAEVFGNLYGTLWQPVEDALESGKTVLLEIDVQGGMSVKKIYKEVQLVFIVPPNTSDLKKRMDGRQRGEDEESRKKRLQGAGEETAKAWQHYDHMVINDDLETAINEIIDIIHGKSGENA